MNRGRTKKLCSLTCIVFVVVFMGLLCVACTLNPFHEAPKMADRTSGWEPHIILSESLYLFNKEAESPFYESFLFEGSSISSASPFYVDLSETNRVIMESALKQAFPNDFIDAGTGVLETRMAKSSAMVFYVGGETLVAVDSKDGRVVQCVDIRIQKPFQDTEPADLRTGFVSIAAELNDLTDAEVRELEAYTGYKTFEDRYLPQYFAEEACPIDAMQAYELASKYLYQVVPSGVEAYVGDGNYIVYDAKASDSWLLYGSGFCLMLDKNTSEMKLFTLNASYTVHDFSTESITP